MVKQSIIHSINQSMKALYTAPYDANVSEAHEQFVNIRKSVSSTNKFIVGAGTVQGTISGPMTSSLS